MGNSTYSSKWLHIVFYSFESIFTGISILNTNKSTNKNYFFIVNNFARQLSMFKLIEADFIFTLCKWGNEGPEA